MEVVRQNAKTHRTIHTKKGNFMVCLFKIFKNENKIQIKFSLKTLQKKFSNEASSRKAVLGGLCHPSAGVCGSVYSTVK